MTVPRSSATQLAVMAVLAMAACSEPPAAPPRTSVSPSAVAFTAPAVCEKTWLYVRDGEWNDEYNWLPSGVPTATDEVCITGVGTYTITIAVNALADSVYVGPGVSVTFVDAGSRVLSVEEELVVAAGASITFAGATILYADEVINDGSLTIHDAAYFSLGTLLDNRAYLELAPTVGSVRVHNMVNTGDLRVEGDNDIISDGRVDLVGGRVLGPGTLRLRRAFSYASVVWSGTLLGARGADANRAQVTVSEMDLTLSSPTLVGAIDVESDGAVVSGDVGSSVSLKLLPLHRDSVQLQPLASAPPGTSVVNHGTILIEARYADTTSSQHLIGSAPLENRGVITALDGTTVHLVVPAFDNRGTVTALADLLLGDSAMPTLTRNFGTITVATGGTLVQKSGSFLATSTGNQAVRFRLESGLLAGGGYVQSVEAPGGSIAPGPGIQTLTIDRLVLGPNATVQMEVLNAGTMDRLRVQG
ncbi:MAG: hypothetical protein IT360_12785, partial [Gemmatimonadaceae bacterium]|nr:hypothetical protein [Gemmatimonadaceae bacterium]